MEISNYDSIQKYLPNTTGITQLEEGQTLGKKDFLTLLLSELTNQNPLEPVDNKDMILQMAQFSSIEQSQTLNDNFEKFVSSSNVGMANSMIGKDVTYVDTGTSTELSGNVEKVKLDKGAYKLVVGGKEVSLSAVTSISNPVTPTP